MEDRELTEDTTSAGDTTSTGEPTSAEDPTSADDAEATDEEEHKLFGVIPLKVALILLVVVLPIVGFLVGMIGSGKETTTVPVDFVISPQEAGGVLQPGATSQFTVLVENPNDYGVRVSSISAGASEATAGGCPAGAVTSEAVTDPSGYISPTSVFAYRVTVTMAAAAADECVGQSFTLPLTAELVSAG